jgi:hypothetical protein
MTAADYADAVQALSAKGGSDADISGGLTRALRARGELKLLPAIVRELKARAARAEALAPRVEVAREKDAAAALTAAKREGIDAATARVNPALVSGWRAYGAGKLADRSGKRALVELYRAATKAN